MVPGSICSLHSRAYKWGANSYDLQAHPRREVAQTFSWRARGPEIDPQRQQNQNFRLIFLIFSPTGISKKKHARGVRLMYKGMDPGRM